MTQRGQGHIPIQTGEMGDFCTTFVFALLSCSSDFPMRFSCFFANLALRRRCSRAPLAPCHWHVSVGTDLLKGVGGHTIVKLCW